MFMAKFPIDKKICGFCKYWVGDANLRFCPGHWVELDLQAKGQCRERNMIPLRASSTCPKFQKRVDF